MKHVQARGTVCMAVKASCQKLPLYFLPAAYKCCHRRRRCRRDADSSHNKMSEKRILFIVDGDKDDEDQRIETARTDAKPAAAVETCGSVDFARFIGWSISLYQNLLESWTSANVKDVWLSILDRPQLLLSKRRLRSADRVGVGSESSGGDDSNGFF